MSTDPSYAPQRLYALQGLRGVAALLVVLFHSAEIWRDLSGSVGFHGVWDRGWSGVDLFFVISGFVMVWVAGDRVAGPRTATRFLWDRATRVYPLWWVFCALMALYFMLTYGQPALPANHSTDQSWGVFLRSMLLWPQGELPVLSVGWTLIYEMAFYALFGLLLLVPAKWRPVGLALWGAFLLYRWTVSPAESGLPSSWSMTIADQLCLEFLLGAGVAYAVKARGVSERIAVGLILIGVGLFLASMTMGSAVDGAAIDRNRVIAFGVPSGLVLWGLVGWELSGERRIAGWVRRIGDASYTLYLSHFIVLLVLKRLFAQVGVFEVPSGLSMVGFMVVGTGISVIAALVLYRVIEQPLLRMTRRPLAKRGVKRQ